LSCGLNSENVNIKIYRTVLPVVLHGVNSGSLSEEQRLRVFENRVLGTVFAHKRDEVTGGRRKLHNDELCSL
jgi:hypothetical protein